MPHRRTNTKHGNDHRGYFASEHDNPPPPFNPDADPLAADHYAKVTASMEADGYYSSHSREECKAEWARRYDALAETERSSSPKPQDAPAISPRP